MTSAIGAGHGDCLFKVGADKRTDQATEYAVKADL